MPIINYTQDHPYFLKHIITEKDGVEKAGFLKIIPDNYTAFSSLSWNNFSGTVQMYSHKMMLVSQSRYVNGVVQASQPSAGASARTSSQCWNQTDIIVHTCSNGGHHLPGEVCDKGTNDAYYEIRTTVKCGVFVEQENEYLTPETGTLTGGGFAGTSIAHQLLTHSQFQHADFLMQPNRSDLFNFVMKYLFDNGYPNGTTLDDSIINSLNQLLDVFVNNPQLFHDFDFLQDQWNATNYYFQGTPNYYDQRIVHLIKNLFENPTQQNAELISGAVQFYSQNPTTTLQQFQPVFTFAQNFLQENPDTLNPKALFLRFKGLSDALLQNPNLILNIPCSELDDWQTVAQHNIPQSVKDKLQNIKNQTSWWSNWQITDLDDGASSRINMDVFPVQISSLPNKPNTTQKYTPEEFFNFFRLNLNLFAEKFTPIVDSYYGINDLNLWNSSNPLGALLHIEIPIDNGTVICSGFGPKAWVFSTIKAPMSMGYDGIHPVSGNRLFGYYVDPNDNKMYIYTRGVDRVSQIATNFPNLANYLIEEGTFIGADKLWKGMQDKLSYYINSNGGNANKLPEKTYRPNYVKVRKYLKGQAPISSLGCN